MSTNFPTALDTLTNPTPTDYLNGPSHAGQHANANDSIEAIQAKVGIDSSDVTTSHDYKLRTGWQAVSDSWAYASADAPTFTITVPSGAASLYSPGMRIKLTQTTVKYFIITAVADTVLTVYGGTDYDLANETITAPYYSTQKAPLGFPLNPIKWTVSSSSSTDRSTASTTYATLTDNIVVPIGIWKICIKGIFYFDNATTTQYYGFITLSSSTTAETYPSLTSAFLIARSGSKKGAPTYIEDTISFDSKTTLTLIGKMQTGATGIGTLGNTGTPTIIRAICAYL